MVSRESPDLSLDLLADNLARIRTRIADAARRADRDPADVRLLVVTKAQPVEHIRLLLQLGLDEFGEGRVQEAEPKIRGLDPGIRWHLIGHLQRNKARRAVGFFSLVHSLESRRLLDTLDRLGAESGEPVDTLLQVNISREGQKYGIEPGEVPDFLRYAAALQGVRIRGLMGMAAYTAGPSECRRCFSDLARIRREADESAWYRSPLAELSMGMTNDFEIAVEEGATMVRVGTAVFSGVASLPADDAPASRMKGRSPGRTEER